MAINSRNTMNWLTTVVVLLTAVNAGMNMGIFNPTLPDIAILTSSTTTQASSTLAAVGFTSMAGAILFGSLFDRFNGLSILSASLLLQGLCMGLAPWCPHLVGYQVLTAAMALFNFVILTGAFASNCRTWESRSEVIAPIIQLTDMLHVLGVAITPQVVSPFVGRLHPPSEANFTTLWSNQSSANANVTATAHFTPVQPIQVAYLIIAGLDFIMAVVCFAVYLMDMAVSRRLRRSEMRRASRRRSYSLNEEHVRRVASQEALAACMKPRRAGSVEHTHVFGGLKSELVALCPEATIIKTDQESVPPLDCSSFSMVVLITTLFIFFASLGSRETMMTGLLFTYLVTNLGWQTSTGTLLITAYHVTRVLLHAVVVVVARWVSPFKLSVFNLIVQLVASGMSLIIKTPFVIAGVILSAVATSNICPTAVTLARMSFQVNGRAMGIFMGAVACGQCIISPVVGLLMERPRAALGFPFILFILSSIAIVFFVPWIAIARVLRRNFDKTSTSSSDTTEVRFAVSGRRSSVKPAASDEKTPLVG